MSSHVGHCDQRHVFSDAKVRELVGFDQDEYSLGRWSLDFSDLAFKVLGEDIMQATAKRNWLFADELEASVERTEDLILQEDARFQSFLDIGIRAIPLSS